MSLNNHDKDFLGRTLEIGMKVVVTLPHDRGLREATIVRVCVLGVWVEYIGNTGKPVQMQRHGRHIYII